MKFTACTLSDRTLTWSNGHVKSLTLTLANSTGWENLKALMLEDYCSRDEVQKLEQELCSLAMKGSDIVAYTNIFSALASLCSGMVTPESKKVESYI